MTAVEALQIALAKEKQAIELYKKMALDYPEIRDLCTDLGNEEYKHRTMIEKKIAAIQRY